MWVLVVCNVQGADNRNISDDLQAPYSELDFLGMSMKFYMDLLLY